VAQFQDLYFAALYKVFVLKAAPVMVVWHEISR